MSRRPEPESPEHSLPPVPEWTYWLEPGRILAGCLPSSREPEELLEKLGALLDAGVRTFVNLMEAEERDRTGTPFVAYADRVDPLAEARGIEVRCLRFPIRDLDIPTRERMVEILAALDAAVERGVVYLHCWGGVGRTGTVAACRLIERARLTPEEALARLAELRRADRRRGHRPSPETPAQRRFVHAWPRGRERR